MVDKRGIIFDSALGQKLPVSGEIVLTEVKKGVKKSARFLTKVFKRLGYLCIYLSILGFLVLFFVPFMSEISYRARGVAEKYLPFLVKEEKPRPKKFVDLMKKEDMQVVPPEERRFKLLIPKIGLEAEVVANVDPANKGKYLEDLKRGLAHAKGTGFPGDGKTVYIFGHSTNYEWFVEDLNALFYLLKELEVGDEVKVVFGVDEFVYQVGEKEIAQATDISFLNGESGRERLVLQTCWPPGTTYKRLLVIAYPV